MCAQVFFSFFLLWGCFGLDASKKSRSVEELHFCDQSEECLYRSSIERLFFFSNATFKHTFKNTSAGPRCFGVVNESSERGVNFAL